MSNTDERLAVIEALVTRTNSDVAEIKDMLKADHAELESVKADMKLMKWALGALVTASIGGGSTLASVLMGGN